MGRATKVAPLNVAKHLMEPPMSRSHDLSRAFVALDQASTLIAVIEMSLSSWLVAGLIEGVDRQPLKKLEPDAARLFELLQRWRVEAEKSGRQVDRVAVAFEAGRDGFWLARWLRERGIECHVIHANSIPVPREHRRAKTDRLDTAMLMRAFLGWLRGEKGHCKMVAVPSVAEEDARCPLREREGLVRERTRLVNQLKSALVRFGISTQPLGRTKSPRCLEKWLEKHGQALPENERNRIGRSLERLRLITAQIAQIEDATAETVTAGHTLSAGRAGQVARVKGTGLQTAVLLETEVFCRDLPDRRAVARLGALSGSPDESGSRRREKGLARAGSVRVRGAMIQCAYRFVMHQPDAALTQWYRRRTENAPVRLRKVMIVALARKLLIALWRFATAGVVPEGVILTPAAQL